MPDRRGAEERRCRRRRRRRGKFRPARRACGEAGRGLRSAPGCGKLPPPDTPPPPRFASLRRSPCSRRSTLAIRGPPLRLERGSPCRGCLRREPRAEAPFLPWSGILARGAQAAKNSRPTRPPKRKKRKENSCSLTNLLLNFYTMVLISWSAGAMLLKGGEHQLRPVLPLLWKGCTQASFRLLQQQVVECWLLAA
ncbi:uncharacterized protein LOC120301403 isoform X2 [Crotalus tigris]|uniref:uncharacterized protein LOC120301403 isoform X2 n=1 Tax=Crotalus tigris TaxID=88082 RepID=UPI00192F76FD|nr:uncharacterized protein LOC120301403 isoform X2 [Crotalus tigris]